jgi:hypothetical protein
MIVPLATPPDETSRTPPLLMVALLSTPPLKTVSRPPFVIWVSCAEPLLKTLRVPPLLIVVLLVAPPDETTMAPLSSNETALPPDDTIRVSPLFTVPPVLATVSVVVVRADPLRNQVACSAPGSRQQPAAALPAVPDRKP